MSVRKRILAVTGAVMFAFATCIVPAQDLIAATGSTAVKKSNYVIRRMDDAKAALGAIASERDIPALVYLKDRYIIREEADTYSKNVGTATSGQLVYITGVDEDGGRNIWYKVRYLSDSDIVTGYVEREFLACSDERLLDWEDRYITTLKRETTASVTDCADIEAFPESYRDALYDLKAAHPEWIFVKMDTGLDFATSVATEGEGERSLIWTKGSNSSWLEARYDSSWSFATDGIIAYYMDPRNFLTEVQIFQFEQLTYNPTYHTESSVQRILNGTFMADNVPGTDSSYASTFMSLAQTYNVSPIHQAARVRQEQGVGGSVMISGTYPGYEGLYNYYNVGAYSSDPIGTGLDYARDKQWTSCLKSLEGGVFFLCKSYIKRGQDTLYLQKYDVDASYDGVLAHQYMQNIAAAYTEADSAYKGYYNAGLLTGTPFVFRIPVYRGMPAGRSGKPDSPDVLSVNMGSIENLPVDQSAVLIPYINGGICDAYDYRYSSSNSSVVTVDGHGVITGVRPGTATVTCTAGSAGAANCIVSVVKADIAMSDVERPNLEITYDPNKKLSDVGLPENFAWADASLVPVVDNYGYTAVYSPDDSRYNSLTLTLDVKVNKATVPVSDIQIPQNIEVTAGAELATVALPAYYSWEDASVKVSDREGTQIYKAVYCIDSANYEATKGIEIPVNIKAAPPEPTVTPEPATTPEA
ncbi:MAG: Ig-like domain-containing protein, partial [Lachnospiraceae bacterium]|nr:Ig-like domain-containing protein [Lachnospiraceae bacterium]